MPHSVPILSPSSPTRKKMDPDPPLAPVVSKSSPRIQRYAIIGFKYSSDTEWRFTVQRDQRHHDYDNASSPTPVCLEDWVVTKVAELRERAVRHDCIIEASYSDVPLPGTVLWPPANEWPMYTSARLPKHEATLNEGGWGEPCTG